MRSATAPRRWSRTSSKRCTGVLETYPDAQAAVQAGDGAARRQRLPAAARRPRHRRAGGARSTANADIDAALKTGDRWAAAEALLTTPASWTWATPAGDDGVDRQLRQWSAEIVACELVGNCRGGIEAALHCVDTGDCAHDDYRDVVLARVPETQRIVFDTMLAATRERMRLVPGRGDADDKPRP